MWNKTNEYNSPVEQVQRLKDAGLNPLYYGLDGSSANSFQSAQTLGYQRAEAPQFGNPVEAFYQTRAAQKNIELANAQIDKIKADTQGVELDNEFKDKTMAARTESESLKNSMTRAQIKEINANRDKITAEIKKVAAETDSEIAKKMLYEAETNLHDMEAKEIAALLPYKQLLMDAQTDAQKAAAAASYARSAIDNGLFEAGYVDNIIDQQCAEYRATLAGAERQEYEAAIAEFKSNLRNGKAIDLSKYEGKPVAKALAKFMNAFYQDTALLGEAIGGVQGLAGVAVGAALKNNPASEPPRTVVKGF